jgi:polar amino acid transport system substrate-binding protein
MHLSQRPMGILPKIRFLCTTGVVLASFVSLVVIDHNIARAQVSEPARFVEEADWPPFTPAYQGATSEGLSYDLISAVFGRIKMPFTLELYPQKRMLRLLERGQRDGATVISRNAVREKFISFSEPIFQKRGLIFFNKKKHPNFSWKSYSDLKGLSIGTVLGHNYGDEFATAVNEFGLLTKKYRREHKTFELLNAERLDIVLSIELVGRKLIAQREYGDAIEAAERPYFLKNYHIGISRLSPLRGRLGEINRAIIELKGEGTLDDIVHRHLKKKK